MTTQNIDTPPNSPDQNPDSQRGGIGISDLLAAATKLHETGHSVKPFMTCKSGMRGCYIKMDCDGLEDTQRLHEDLVMFFAANS